MKRLIVILIVFLFPISVSATEPVRIAAVFDKTGPAVIFDKDRPGFFAIRFAVQELNAKGGFLGHPIKVLEFDTRSTALGAKQAADEAVIAGVIAVIGASRSSQSLAMAPILQSAKIPMITPESTNPDVTKAGNYIFRDCFIDDFQGEVLASFALTDLKAKKAVVLTNTGDQYSLGLARFFMDKFRKLGGQVLWEGDYLGSASDFTEQLKKVKALNPDVIFVPGYDTDTGFIVKQSREMGIPAIFLSGDGVDESIYKYAGTFADGLYRTDHWHQKSVEKISKKFVHMYMKEHGGTIEPATPLTYDAVMLLADAVKRAKSVDPTKIRDALAATKGFKGVTGDITFDENRNPVKKSAVIMKFERGKSVYVKTIKP